MARVQLKHIAKSWVSSGKTSVGVKEMSLDIADGEFLVLLGPSGCGKTTTMRMVAGLEDATQGEIWIGDRKVNDLEPKDRDVAMVFQSYGLYPNMTVYENISFPLRIRGTKPSEIDPAVKRAAEKVELMDFLDRRPKELSGGQRQRVALARAIVRQPAVFLMDEPLSNLDAKLRVSMRSHIKHLHHELKTTTIYVTHDQIEAMTLADRVVVMSKAEVQQIGTPEQIYGDPANLFVASFIGNPSMNLINGKLDNGAFVAEGIRIEGMGQGSHEKVVLGVRAEDLMLANTDIANIRGDVFSFELTGDATLITLQCGTQRITARSSKEFRAGIGEKLQFLAAPERSYLFDGQTQNRLRFDRS
ncbi:sn-glycerol-3-phosphate ABC transporter ATP-binding protein UgpC [Variovorax sp. PCZ-1]|uniref:ABC transporter ATP-binding protein n=1 Tax=Variovorax sp. PCZ-1 TaxID=2835533 RepID=UPI001BCD6D00|nr:sn-glycerol-3-phosphate ABC transporter ATP-binding protein UgpC [Variovorax sp. PCZ-1]MBS7807907.1 sn-glycerol-3-phosphate ABC transporter ATP-binding protein UgpC [Variovorax sp. PCZ-1]